MSVPEAAPTFQTGSSVILSLPVSSKVFERLVPLGSWCRTAYQCRSHAKQLGLEVKSGPFDWSITPFRALSVALRDEINPDLLLNPIDSYINRVGSVTCGYTGIAFHHDLAVADVKSYGGQANDQTIPTDLIESEQWARTKNRFLHTFNNFQQLFQKKGNLYVRWMNIGRGAAIGRFPTVFDGETPGKIRRLLSLRHPHNQFGLLHVTTEIMEDFTSPIEEPIKTLALVDVNTWACILRERRGFNGDQTINYKGDEAAWGSLFNKIIKPG